MIIDKNLALIIEIRDEIVSICNHALHGPNGQKPDFVMPNVSEVEYAVLDSAANIIVRINAQLSAD